MQRSNTKGAQIIKYMKKGKLHLAIIHNISNRKDKMYHLVASSKTDLRKMIKVHIRDALKKNHTVIWNKDTKYQVQMWRESEYSELYKETSETIKYYTKTVVGMGENCKVREHHVLIRANPHNEDNPECKFCYKQVTSVYNDELLDEAKTVIKVCSTCRKELSKMRKILVEMDRDRQ